MMKKKGSILIEALIGFAALMIAVNLVLSLAQLVNSLEVLSVPKSMDSYWVNISHFFVYFPWPEPIVDIAY